MGLSELEKKRLENIQRNKELLQELELDSLSSSIKKEIDRSASSKRRKTTTSTKKKPAVKREPAVATRRSNRIAGIKTALENPDEYQKQKEEEELKAKEKAELQRLERTRLFGDYKLLDLITDRKGNVVHKHKISHGNRKTRGTKALQESLDGEASDNEVEGDNDVEQNTRVLELVKSLGNKFSAGDFYDIIRKSEGAGSSKSLESKRKEFDKLHIHERFDPLDIKVCHKRITSMAFHPSVDDRIVAAGDTEGNLGIWLVDDNANEEEPSVTILHPHGRNVSKILIPSFAPEKLYSSSYDGSVRCLDLNKLSSSELIYLNDPGSSSELAVSDIHQVQESDLFFMTTLSGEFFQRDLREPSKQRVGQKDLLRLHDKKIGGFSLNPNNTYQIATASLDRSLRIWDLRNVSKSVYSEFEGEKSPHLYGSYESRLSISCVDWNQENRIVCNGYDDKIALFNYSGGNGLPAITEWDSTYQPGGVKVEDGVLPNNLTPFTTIRHNCQTGRWVSILKSHWQRNPVDGFQKFIIANMNRGLDIYDQDGHIIAHLNESVGAVPAVCTLHPTKNWVVGGSASGKLYLFE